MITISENLQELRDKFVSEKASWLKEKDDRQELNQRYNEVKADLNNLTMQIDEADTSNAIEINERAQAITEGVTRDDKQLIDIAALKADLAVKQSVYNKLSEKIDATSGNVRDIAIIANETKVQLYGQLLKDNGIKFGDRVKLEQLKGKTFEDIMMLYAAAYQISKGLVSMDADSKPRLSGFIGRLFYDNDKINRENALEELNASLKI